MTHDTMAMYATALPWAEFKADFMAAYEPGIVTKKQAKRVRQVLAELEALDLADVGDPPRRIQTTADLSLRLISRYLDARRDGVSPYTLRSLLTVIATICNAAVRCRCLAVSPFAARPVAKLVPAPVSPPGKRHLTRDECRRLLDQLRQAVESKKGWALWRARRDQAVIATALYTGLRARECLTLHVADIDLTGRIIALVPREGRYKTAASAAPVGMPLALVPILDSWLSHRLDAPPGFVMPESVPWVFPCIIKRDRPWLSGGPGSKPLDRLQAAGRRAGTDHVDFPTLRRTLATAMEAQHIAPGLIQRTLRHTRASTTVNHYRRADPAAIADGVKDVTF